MRRVPIFLALIGAVLIFVAAFNPLLPKKSELIPEDAVVVGNRYVGGINGREITLKSASGKEIYLHCRRHKRYCRFGAVEHLMVQVGSEVQILHDGQKIFQVSKDDVFFVRYEDRQNGREMLAVIGFLLLIPALFSFLKGLGLIQVPAVDTRDPTELNAKNK